MTTRFRIDAKHIGLTYPQCDLTRERVLDSLRSTVGDKYVCSIIAIEQHADGTPHIHAYLGVSSKRCIRDPRLFDIDGFHANIQGLRVPKNWCRYIQKEDKSCLMDGAVSELLSGPPPKERISDAIAARLDAGATRDEIYAEYPGFYLMNKRKVDDMCDWIVSKRLNTGKKDWSECLARLIDSRLSPMTPESQLDLAGWLIENIKVPRKLRQPQLWLHGPPGCGKTTLVMELEKYLRVYWVPMDCNGFFDGFSDDYDLIVFDEMKSQFKLTLLNQLICGGPMRLNQKGTSVQKTKNPPVMFLSNYGPAAAYKTLSPQFDAFMDRIIPVHCTSLHQLNQIVQSVTNHSASVSTPSSPQNE